MACLTLIISLFIFLACTSVLSHAKEHVKGSHYHTSRLSFVTASGSSNRGGGSSSTPPTSSNHKHRHKWIGPIGNRVITVDVNGSGEFQSVQAAVNAVVENNTVNVTILIRPGYYM